MSKTESAALFNVEPGAKTQTYDPGDGGAPFRCGVGLIIINQQGQTMAFQRRLQPGEWQWPQGGVYNGEDINQAIYRELHEEIGLHAHDVELLLRLPEPTLYLFPDYIDGAHPTEGVKYRGQRHDWFVFLFKGDEAKLKYDHTDEVEFSGHRWCNLADMPTNIVPFKRKVYEQVVNALLPHMEKWQTAWRG